MKAHFKNVNRINRLTKLTDRIPTALIEPPKPT
jgi:hypothetical protein